MRALLLPKYDRMAASTRHRLLQYIPALSQAGIDCDVEPLFDARYLTRKFGAGRTSFLSVAKGFSRRIATLLRARRYDLVLVYSELLPYLPRWFERSLSWSRIPHVVDVDDAFFLQYGDQASRVVRWLYGDKFRQVFGDAALVMAGNEYLAQYARQTAKWVEVVPTVVDTDQYSPRQGSSGARAGFTIGWIGSPSTAPYLDLVAESLKKLSARDDCRLVLVGAGEVSLPGVRLVRRDWSEATEVSEIREFDVGIMPLPDTLWARGKCGFKLIQCMACGVPVVASPVGVNADLVDEGVNGFLAADTAQWMSALERLRDDRPLRLRMGLAGRSKVEGSYSLRVVAPRVTALLRKVASATPHGVAVRERI